MKQAAKAVLGTLLLSAGAATASYFTITPFRQAVDDFIKRFKDDMDHREEELIEALSSTDEEIAAARDSWDSRKDDDSGFKLGRGRHRGDSADDDEDLIMQ